VEGKSCVKGTICNFEGIILLTEIRTARQVNADYAAIEIKSYGVSIATYEFKEKETQEHSGIFKGQLYSKWYVDSKDKLSYDDVLSMADGYSNNAFVGIWKSYASGKEKICNWADGRVPKANPDFDVGIGEFGPSEKYLDKGWRNYQLAWLKRDEGARKVEIEEWWR